MHGFKRLERALLMSSEAAIHVSNLSKRYEIYETPRDRLKQFVLPRLKHILGRPVTEYFREFWALKDISFEIHKGETVGIIGRNGSGKSTLLQLICGTLTPSSGKIHTQGRIAALLELGTGFNPEFSGRENVYMNAALLGLTTEQINQRFAEIEAFADIGEFIDHPVKTYSSGMYVRLAFAVVAHVDANILIIDEALAVGDALFTQKCMRFLRKFKENGTLLFVSHDAASVTALCDKALWLDHGTSQLFGPAKSVSEAYIASLYDGVSGQISDNGTEIKKNVSTTLKNNALQKDFRIDLINSSNLRNDIEIFRFDPLLSDAFGVKGAKIFNVMLLNESCTPISFVTGGEKVILHVEAQTSVELDLPIVGFSVKDKLGQVLFGDNTYLSHQFSPIRVGEGENLVAEFHFMMPILPPGDFSFSVAIANGTQNDHVQHHWIHDALIIKSLSSSVSTGLIGIPMHGITLRARQETTLTK
jgi:lipopolysaccharide transport system ATP-binding protein